MYSSSKVAVDKGLGFDFSSISDLVKTALPVGLQIFNQQAQLKQIQTMQQTARVQGYAMPSAGQYLPPGQLPLSAYLQPQPTFGGQYAQPSQGMDMTTMALIGMGTLVAGLLAFKMLK
jgi:hypothetical protein